MLADALTTCPGCRADVPLKASKCPHCGGAADTSSAFISYRVPGGSGMVDQVMAAYLRSPCGKPAQKDLDQLFEMTTRIQFMEKIFIDSKGTFQPQLEIATAADITELRAAIRISEKTPGHLMMSGNHRLDFFQGDVPLAQIELVAGCLLRWANKWQDDAPLLSPLLAGFLKARGCAKLQEQHEKAEEESRESQRKHAAWLTTWESSIPKGLGPFIDDLAQEKMTASRVVRPKALAILATSFATTDEQILALLAWYGHRNGNWSGIPMAEWAPEYLLDSYSVEQLASVIESHSLSRPQLEGAARFIIRRAPPSSRDKQKVLVERCKSTTIRQKIVSHALSTGDNSKFEVVERVLGKP